MHIVQGWLDCIALADSRRILTPQSFSLYQYSYFISFWNGKERKGKERKGKERKGTERNGKERKGKFNDELTPR